MSRPFVLPVHRLTIIGVALVVTWIVAGCQSSTEEEAAVPPLVQPETILDPAEPASPYELDEESAEEIRSDHDLREITPMQRYLNKGASVDEITEDALREADEYDEEIRSCMTTAGFEYVPSARAAAEYEAAARSPASDLYVTYATLGYGISTYLGRGPIFNADDYRDPNWDIHGALPPEEQAAYGEQFNSCQEHFFATMNDEFGGDEFANQINEEILEIFAEIDARIEADEAVRLAQERWRTCMTEAGYPADSQAELQEGLQREANAIIDAVGLDLLSGTIRAEDMNEPWRTRLDELQTRERSIAQADVGCRRELDDTLFEARVHIEQAFLDAEGERIDRILLLVDEARAEVAGG